MDYFRVLAQMLQEQGRGNDTLLAHITPDEARLLKRRGGSGTRNPVTGLLEFYDSDGSGDASDSGNPTGGDSGGYGGGDESDGYDGGLGGDPTAGLGDEIGGYNDGNSGGGDGGGGYYEPSFAPVAAPPPPRQFGVDPNFRAQLARSQNIGVPQVTIASAPATPFSAYLPLFPTISLLTEPPPNYVPTAPSSVPASPAAPGAVPMPPAVPMASRDLGASVSLDEFLRPLRGYL